MTKNELVIFTEEENNLISLESLDAETKDNIENSLSAGTRRIYKSDFKLFKEWCEEKELPYLPASPVTVARFLSHEAARGIKPATLTRRLAAIRFTHEIKEFESPTQNKNVRGALQGVKRKRGVAPIKKAPITAERLEMMISHCPDSLAGLRDRALLLLGFAGAFRRSELVALEINDIEPTPEGIKVTIRKSKTDQEGQGQTIAILNGSRLRVVDVLMHWLKEANIQSGHIFRSIKKGGAIQDAALSTQSVADIVKRYANKAGLKIDNFSAHSLRAGFITSGAAAGADLFKLMEVSRHKKPETVMGYVRESKLFDNHAGEKFL